MLKSSGIALSVYFILAVYGVFSAGYVAVPSDTMYVLSAFTLAKVDELEPTTDSFVPVAAPYVPDGR